MNTALPKSDRSWLKSGWIPECYPEDASFWERTSKRIAWKSLLNRRFSALLTIGAIALSVMLLIGVERIRTETRASFANTISGTDLIVGARSGSIQLLLFSVFRIGNATNNITWESYQDIAGHDAVAWTVPISLGDSHRGSACWAPTTVISSITASAANSR